MAILEIKGLSKNFGGLRALDAIELAVHEGEILGIIGPNGSGKTTLLSVITGFLKPTTGSIKYDGQSIVGLKPQQIAETGIVRTFQITSLFPNLTTEQNIIAGRYLRTSSSMLGSFFNTRRYREEEMKQKQKVREILSVVGMEERRDMFAKNLPGGDQRKLEIAIALAGEPKLLLLDEPAAGMNPEEAKALVDLLQSVHKSGIHIAIVEHNMKVVMGLCTRIAVLNYGSKVVEGTPEQIANNDLVKSIYLGTKRNAKG